MKRYYLEATVFICGACVMVLELTGSRVLAPYVGTSIIVWTSLIGVILASLSAGYYYGGKRADKGGKVSELALIIFCAAAWITIMALLKEYFLSFLVGGFKDLRMLAVVATLVLFAPASVALGMVSPYALKLKTKELEKVGEVGGSLYALSTVGSIVGTFATGFFLVSYLGNTAILYVLAGVLGATAVCLYQNEIVWKKIAAIFFLLFCFSAVAPNSAAFEAGTIDIDTQYQRVHVLTKQMKDSDRLIRLLKTDPYGIQSGAYLDSTELLFEYNKRYDLFSLIHPAPAKVLMIGGGAFTYPNYFLDTYKTSAIDVVEVDPKLTEVSKTYFNLKDNDRLSIFHEDGRMFINNLKGTYDVILVDAFNSMTVPFHLTTKEFVEKLYKMLPEKGVVLVNLINPFEGENATFFKAEYATYKSIFPQVEVFKVTGQAPTEMQNIMLMAYKSKEPIKWEIANEKVKKYIEQRWTKPVVQDVPILTDDHAPVDQYLMNLYK